jgi:predicted RNA-binding protein YlxR (DUF448 family)
MVRISIPDGALEVSPGAKTKRFGRGAYVCPNEDCIAKVATQGRVWRALRWKGQPPAPETLRDAVNRAMKEMTENGCEN